MTALQYGIFCALSSNMAEAPKEERRRTWSKKDRERLQEYERQWQRRPEEIREEDHDRRSKTIRGTDTRKSDT
jgi:hypothetical protein